MNRRVNYKTIEELKLLQVQYILNSASDSFKGPKWHMRLYKNPGTSLRVSMGMQLSFRSHWWLRCLEDERCNRAELSRALGRWVPQHQCCGKVPGKFSRRFQAENERSQRLLECSSIWGEGKKLCGWWKGLKTFESFLFLALWGRGLPGYWEEVLLALGVPSRRCGVYLVALLHLESEIRMMESESLVGDMMKFCLSMYLDI